MHILIVDDDQVVREGIRGLIAGFKRELDVRTAANGYAALQMCREVRPDIVFADIQMPGMSGLEMIRCMKQTYQVPMVVGVSGHAEFHYAQRALQLNETDYILKPVSLSMFNRVFLNACELAQMSRHEARPARPAPEDMRRLREEMARSLLLGGEAPEQAALWERMDALDMNAHGCLVGLAAPAQEGTALLLKQISDSPNCLPYAFEDGAEKCAFLVLFSSPLVKQREASLIRDVSRRLRERGMEICADCRRHFQGTGCRALTQGIERVHSPE